MGGPTELDAAACGRGHGLTCFSRQPLLEMQALGDQIVVVRVICLGADSKLGQGQQVGG
ncbi:MAG: hypothetical protein ACRDPY_06770 [Streptosporangiaceae bacterium]